MYRFVREPRWLIFATVVGIIALLFVNLGFWQLRRLDARQFDNAVQSERRAAEVVPIDLAVDRGASFAEAGEAHEGRRVSAAGTFDASGEVLLRSRTHQGEAGFHVITPLVLADGSAVLVNRGWVPIDFDTVPLGGPAAAPSEPVTVTGVLEASATQPRFGPQELPGERTIFIRSNVDRLSQQIEYPLYPVVLIEQAERALPVPVELEELDDGPHLPYAIQWFSFAAISLIGYGALVRSTAKKAEARRARVAQSVDPETVSAEPGGGVGMGPQ